MKTNKEELLKEYGTCGNAAEAARNTGTSTRTAQRWIKEFYDSKKNVVMEKSPDPVSIGNPQQNIKLKNGVVVVFSDAHIIPRAPRSTAAEALLKVLKRIKPTLVINGGDLFDFASVSKHEVSGWNERFTVKEEIDVGVEYLKDVTKATPSSRFIGLQGNHDCRFNKFLANHVPQFKGIVGFNIMDHFPTGWSYAISIMLNDNTVFVHNHHGGVHAAYNNAMKGGVSVITGHTHILEVKPITDYSGDRFGVQTGTLATIQGNPLFAYTNGTPLNWQAGFVVLTYVDGKLLYPEICHVARNGKAYFRGKEVV